MITPIASLVYITHKLIFLLQAFDTLSAMYDEAVEENERVERELSDMSGNQHA
jgi:hypothetical protein